MLIEYFAPSFIYTLVKDIWKATLGRKRVTPEEKIAKREKWKQPFESEILKNFQGGLRQDVIIRDVARYDQYPKVEEKKKGISAWFRLALIDTYHDGILVWVEHEELIETAVGKYRKSNHHNNEGEKISAMLVGKIPFHNIENVDFEGDEYYNFPQIFCHFTIKKMPYESLDYYLEHKRNGFPPFYTEIASQKDVLAESKQAMTRN